MTALTLQTFASLLYQPPDSVHQPVVSITTHAQAAASATGAQATRQRVSLSDPTFAFGVLKGVLCRPARQHASAPAEHHMSRCLPRARPGGVTEECGMTFV
jgi:hypothetical protein